MGSWTKLLGIGANREPDVRELAPAAVGSAVREAPVDEIHTNPFQPRRWFREEALAELSVSVREYGVLQPLLVRLDEQGGYELIAGERRLRASKLAGRATVPVIVVEMSDQEVAEVGLIENLQREDLHFLEEAESYKQLLGFFGLTAEKLAERLGKSASSVSGRLRLLKLEPAVRDAVVQSGISEKHAQALLKLGNAAAQLAAIQRIGEANLTARETEQWVNLTLADAAGPAKAKPATAEKALASVRDVRMVLNVLRHMTGDLKREGVPVQMNQRQEDGFLKLELLIPLKQAKK